jgi:hypothetical protein
LISPVLLLILGVGIFLYAVLTLTLVSVAAVLFASMVALIVAGIVELIYGIMLLFDTVSVALIELGVGTVLFAAVTAVVALIYEVLFGWLPGALKGITFLLKRYLRWIITWLYGGRA